MWHLTNYSLMSIFWNTNINHRSSHQNYTEIFSFEVNLDKKLHFLCRCASLGLKHRIITRSKQRHKQPSEDMVGYYGLLATPVIASALSSQPISGRVDRASASETVDLGSIPGQIKPKTIKIGIHSCPAWCSAIKETAWSLRCVW